MKSQRFVKTHNNGNTLKTETRKQSKYFFEKRCILS